MNQINNTYYNSAGVGPFGLTTNMGITVLNNMVGNGADSIHGVECVTASGEWLRVIEGDDEHSELLRVIRGGGGATWCIEAAVSAGERRSGRRCA